jgi:hypothetical protein
LRIKYICISKNRKIANTESSIYILQVGLSEIPSEIWKQYFYFKCRKGTIIRKKAINMLHDELILNIEKGRNVQDYIESIKQLVAETNKLVERHRMKCTENTSVNS